MLDRVRTCFAVLVVLGALSPLPFVSAQEPASDPVSVQVVLTADEGGFPVSGVFVEVEDHDQAQMSNADGVAVLDLIPGTYLIKTHHIAYHDITTALVVPVGESVTRAEFSLRIRAIPLSPLLVEARPAISVLENRLVTFPQRTKAFDNEEIQKQVTTDLIKSLSGHAGVAYLECMLNDPGARCKQCSRDGSPAICWATGYGAMETCAYLDEVLIPEGLYALRGMPTQDIGRVEFFPHIGIVRVYTKDFLIRAAERPGLIVPLPIIPKSDFPC